MRVSVDNRSPSAAEVGRDLDAAGPALVERMDAAAGAPRRAGGAEDDRHPRQSEAPRARGASARLPIEPRALMPRRRKSAPITGSAVTGVASASASARAGWSCNATEWSSFASKRGRTSSIRATARLNRKAPRHREGAAGSSPLLRQFFRSSALSRAASAASPAASFALPNAPCASPSASLPLSPVSLPSASLTLPSTRSRPCQPLCSLMPR